MDKYARALELWQSYHISSTADLDKYLDNFRILFAFHSGKIENEAITYHDTRGIFENGLVLNYTGNPRALFEQQNQKLCFEVLKEKIIKKEPLSVEFIKEIQKSSPAEPTMNADISQTRNVRANLRSTITLLGFRRLVPPQRMLKAI